MPECRCNDDRPTYCPMHGCPHSDAAACDCRPSRDRGTHPGPRVFTGPHDHTGIETTIDPVTGYVIARIPPAAAGYVSLTLDPAEEGGPVTDRIISVADLNRGLSSEHPLESLMAAVEAHPASSPTSRRARDILEHAAGLVDGQRAADYGDARDNFNNIAALWSIVLDIEITAEQVALCLAQLKIARLIHTPTHDDSWTDLAGYAGLGGGIAQQTVEESVLYDDPTI